MSEPIVSFSQDGALGSITLNRPPVNAYEITLMQQLEAAIEESITAQDVKVVILRSALEKFFCGGADIKGFLSNDVDANMGMVETAHRALGRMAASTKVFIAAINGHALGGGMEMALACDLRIASEGDYRLGLPEAGLGLLPGNGGTQRLPRLIGQNKALELMLFATTLTPQKALEVGLVNRLLAAEDFQAEVDKLATRLASGATFAMAQIKRAVYEGMEMNLIDGLGRERELLRPLFASEDTREGITAFVEKRKPEFKGR